MRNIISCAVLCLISSVLLGQDRIIQPVVKYDIIKCKISHLVEGKLFYNKTTNNAQGVVYFKDISSLSLSDSVDEIKMPYASFDTILCKIDGIDEDYIFYFADESEGRQRISRSDVFMLQFESSPYNPYISFEADKFLANCLYGNRKFSQTIFKKDGGSFRYKKIGDIIGEKVYLDMTTPSGSTLRNTTINLTSISLIEMYKPELRFKNTSTSYILSASSNSPITSTEVVIQNEVITFLGKRNDISYSLSSNKNEVAAIILNNTKNLKESSQRIVSKSDLKRKAELNAGGGASYSLGKAEEGQEDYIDGLRWGFNISANLNSYFDGKNGLGFTYKYFHTANSADDLDWVDENGEPVNRAADNINVSFFGLNYITSHPFGNNGIYDFALAAGYVRYKNKVKQNNDNFDLTANSFGDRKSVV